MGLSRRPVIRLLSRLLLGLSGRPVCRLLGRLLLSLSLRPVIRLLSGLLLRLPLRPVIRLLRLLLTVPGGLLICPEPGRTRHRSGCRRRRGPCYDGRR